MNIQQLYAFQAVYETRSFSEAAKRMKITQSGVTQLIQGLEKELKCILFIRLKRPISAAEAANVYYPYVKVMLETYEKSLQELKVLHPQSFTLAYRVTSEGVLDQFLCADPTLAYFDIENLTLEDFNSTTRWKENHLYFVRENIIKSKNVLFVPAYTSGIYAVLAASSELAKKEKLYLEDLKGHTVLLPLSSNRTIVAQKLSGLFKTIPEITVKEVSQNFDLSIRYVSIYGYIAFCTEEFIRKSEYLRYVEIDVGCKLQYGFAALGTMTPDMKKFVSSFIEWNQKQHKQK